MQEIIIAIGLGTLLGFTDILSYRTKEILSKISTASLLLMLFCLGAKIGCDADLLQKLTILGWKSVVIALSVIIGSVTFLWLLTKLFATEITKIEQEQE